MGVSRDMGVNLEAVGWLVDYAVMRSSTVLVRAIARYGSWIQRTDCPASLTSIRRIIATLIIASEVAVRRSQSRTRRWLRTGHPKVRSTTLRRGGAQGRARPRCGPGGGVHRGYGPRSRAIRGGSQLPRTINASASTR